MVNVLLWMVIFVLLSFRSQLSGGGVGRGAGGPHLPPLLLTRMRLLLYISVIYAF